MRPQVVKRNSEDSVLDRDWDKVVGQRVRTPIFVTLNTCMLMKKPRILNFWAVAALLCSATFVSCESEEDVASPLSDDTLKTLSVSYSVEVSEDYLNFFDVYAIYGKNQEEGVTSTISGIGWMYEENFSDGSVVIPDRVFCRVIAIPKATTPEIDTEKTYIFEANYSMKAWGVRANGQHYSPGTITLRPRLPVPGHKLSEMLAKGERTIESYSCEIEK